ncbi:MAG: serine--tRNA ligase [Thermoflexia bacterium]|nr:MAG: serine--tRNA ligase [Thermoflexia bacterium]
MIDIALIRRDPQTVRNALLARGEDPSLVDRVLEVDARWRALLTQVEELRAERNRVSREIGRMKDPVQREPLIAQMRAVGDRIAELEDQVRVTEAERDDLLLRVPNVPHPSVPVGPDASHNVLVRQWGEPRSFEFDPLPHWDLGPELGILDFERGIKLAGSRFYVLWGAGALLERALIAWMIHVHTHEHGYTEVYLPFVVKRECLLGAGQLPKFEDNLYHDVEDDLWLVPTAEVPLTNLHRDEILPPDALPLRYVAYTPCFRRERMSAGRDIRGIKRGHQFDKVEIYQITTPEASYDALEEMLEHALDLCRRLEIPHRVVQLCTGDLGFAAARTYDIEMWAPGCGEWLEVSSVSNCEDFQARRANIRYRPEPNARPRFVHTLNGSGLALPRVVIAILENYQQPDGSVVVPEVLRPWMGGLERIG